MDDKRKHEKDISIAYQSGMEDGSRLDKSMDDAEITKLGIERGNQWATAALEGAPYPERL